MASPNRRTAVIALGGNALSPPGERSTIADQFRHTRESLGPVVSLVMEGWNLCIVHGNGPQVGDELVRNEIAGGEVAELPLGVLVATTAGWIGYMIQQSVENALRRAGNDRRVVTLLTQVEVSATDPSLEKPTKFIGHSMTDQRADQARRDGHEVRRDPRGEFRRVVGSPSPTGIHEIDTIRELAERGTIVIACGGGGIPVYRDATGNLEGLDAVVDKDLAAGMLASDLGAELLLILTDIDAVYSNFGEPAARAIRNMTPDEADSLIANGSLDEGSMTPKVRAAADFVRRTNGRAIITELSRGLDAVHGRAGTAIAR
ncbi:MAG: carbamate kinase [Gemmatimonadaceae bacterium]